MKAIVIHQHGGSDVLSYEDVAEPQLMGGDLLVETKAIGLNYIDTYHRSGAYSVALPFVPGMEAAGIVLAAAPDVTNFQVGDLVAWGFNAGSYAERVRVSADKAIRVPAGVSAEQAAAVMLQGMTAHYLVESTFCIEPGHIALVHAAAGGVGQLLCQLIALKGATAIGTVSTEAKAEIARAAGAAHVIRYDREDVVTRIREITDGAGVNVVYDGVGKDTFDASLSSLRPRGLLALFGAASGPVPAFDLQRLNAGGSLFITRPSLGHHLLTRAEFEWRAGEIFALIAEGKLHIDIGATFTLDNAAAAHDALEGRKTTGKVLLIPSV